MISKRPQARLALLLLVPLLLLAACDRALAPGTHPVGAILLLDGTEVAVFEQGVGATGELMVGVGQTRTFRVRLFDREGNLTDVDGEEFSLRNPHIIITHAVELTLEVPDRIVLRGNSVVDTHLQFEVWHAGHQEFEVAFLPVRAR